MTFPMLIGDMFAVEQVCSHWKTETYTNQKN